MCASVCEAALNLLSLQVAPSASIGAFQSHNLEFDLMRSEHVPNTIQEIQWLKRCNNAHLMLSTNGACAQRCSDNC
jgi:hypothetical protein